MIQPGGKIKLGEWLPDLPAYENPGLTEALNCIPIDRHYTDYNVLLTQDDALPDRVVGAFAAVDTIGDTHLYMGIDSALYIKAGTSYTDLGGSFSTAATGYWRFAQFDTTVVAVNFTDTSQAITAGASTTAALATSGTAPKGRQVGVIGRFVMIGDTDYGGNAIPHRVQWGAINTARDWPTPNTSEALTKQAGEQILPATHGAVTAIASGEFYGLVFQQRAISRFTYIGGDKVFQVQAYELTRGCWFPQAMVQVGQLCYYIAVDGFYVTDGQTVRPIGNAKVDKFFFSDCDQTYTERVTGAIDYQTKCIYWCYPNFTASSGTPNRVIIYNWSEDRWSHAVDTMDMIFPSRTDGLSLEQLDAIYGNLDAISLSLDSPVFQGGQNVVMGFGTDHKMGTLSGAAAIARFDTGEFDLNPMGYLFVRGVRPLVTGAPTGVTVAICNRETQDNSSRIFGTAVSRTARTGICDFRDHVKFGSLRLEVTGGFDRALSLDVDAEQGDGV